jgi:hypothetical protein
VFGCCLLSLARTFCHTYLLVSGSSAQDLLIKRKSFGVQYSVLHQSHRAGYNYKMSSMRAMHPMDLLKLEKVNLDPLTETYHIGFYLEYLAKWPHLCRVIVSRDDEVEAYSKLS